MMFVTGYFKRCNLGKYNCLVKPKKLQWNGKPGKAITLQKKAYITNSLQFHHMRDFS